MLTGVRVNKGFALPTILIASVVMMIVLLVAVSSTAGVRTAIFSQNYSKLAQLAGEAGTEYAKSCLAESGNIPTWDDDTPLKPNTDCTGADLVTCDSIVDDPLCYVISDGSAYATFSVGLPEVNSAGASVFIPSLGTTQILRTSNSAVWRSYEYAISSKVVEGYADDGMPLGTSISGYWDTLPFGYLEEDGSAVSRTAYSELFALIGTTFGSGDGSTTFNLPDSRGRAQVSIDPSDTNFDELGETYGAKTHTLTSAEMPVHDHDGATNSSTVDGRINSTDGVEDTDDQEISAGSTSTSRYGAVVASSSHTHTMSSEGGGQAHNNIQPSIVKKFAIKYIDGDVTESALPAGASISGYWSVTPTGFLEENGSAVSRATYSDLFGEISTTFGSGDGSTTFNLPDSRGRVTVNLNPSDSEFDTVGETYGEKNHTLTLSELAAHDHGGSTSSNKVNVQFSTQHENNSTRPRAGNDTNVSVETLRGSGHTHTIASEGGGVSHNNTQPVIALMTAVKHTDGSASKDNVATGTSIAGYWSSLPSSNDYLLENGASVSRSTYDALFATISTTFGSGDGSTTFNLPDSRGRVGVNQSLSDTEFNTMGELYGEKTHALTIDEMPAHDHGGSVAASTFGSTSTNSFSNDDGGSGSDYMKSGHDSSGRFTRDLGGSSHSHSIPSAGGGDGHNNIQPSITKLHGIKSSAGIPMSDYVTIGEIGVIDDLTDATQTINLANSYTNPVVVMGTPSYVGSDPITVRVNNVTATSFDVYIQEWDYDDGNHSTTPETVAYMVVEAGVHTFENGYVLEAQNQANVDETYSTVNFTSAFTNTPIVLGQIVSNNGPSAVNAHVQNVGTSSFEVRSLEEEAGASGGHNAETISWVAIEPSNQYNKLGLLFAVKDTTGSVVTDSTTTINFGFNFPEPVVPALFAREQTTAGSDPFTVRYTSLTTTSADIFLDEETSADSETSHAATEDVGYIVTTTGFIRVPSS